MKRMFVFTLALLLLLSPLSALADWYCPKCGRLNDNNFCPVDGTARPADTSSSGIYTGYAYRTATLNAKLATRTGPGTQYDEPGTFLSAGSQVTALSRAYDARNGIWWIQVEFRASGSLYRAYTGLKRFSNLNANSLPEEKVIGSCAITQSIVGYYGPGYNYREIGRKIPAGVSCAIYGYASSGNADFLQVEFYDQFQGCYRRAWINAWNAEDWQIFNGY